MSLVLLNSYSSNNKELHKVTLHNHAWYCGENGYSSLELNEPYNKWLNTGFIRELLRSFEYVVTIGSDCIFTGTAPLEQFLDSEHCAGICEEGTPNSVTNGEVNLFRSCDEVQEFLDSVEELQKQYKDVKWGWQSIANRIVRHALPPRKHLQVLTARTLQGYISKEQRFSTCLWKPGTLIAHAVGLDNQDKQQRCENFLKEHKELL